MRNIDRPEFQKMIFTWWEEHKRDLPWRRTRDPYRIFVSEIMLQQTQVARVITKYDEFLHVFPSVYSLAGASSADVLRVWRGMGYNRRALYLKKTAEIIVQRHNGNFPEDQTELMQLPGLGKYTACAILVFAYKKDIAMVDTNIRKIITHFFFNGVPQKESIIEKTAQKLVPKGKSWEWHQALMDYGALQMTKVKLQMTNERKNVIPFTETDRYYRGRIVDLLREREYLKKELILHIHATHKNSYESIVRILDGLLRDGLIMRKGRTLSLPE